MAEDQVPFEKMMAHLHRHHLKITQPRKKILKVLLAQKGPFTIEEIFKKIDEKGCDLVTVYRVLQVFEKMGLVQKCDFGDRAGRYEWVPSDRPHHHHIRCRICKKIEPIDYCGVENVEPAIGQVLRYKEISHSLEFFGICPDCQKSRG